MADLELTIALERYDRHVPFFMGTLTPPKGLRLRPLEVGMAPPRRDGIERHRRFLQDGEFDIAETSLSSHIMAVSRGEPFVGIPAFPRRLFSQNHIFVNAASGIAAPADLIGKRVILRTFQTTMSVLALGDLKFEYGVPWDKIRWIVSSEEALPLDDDRGMEVEHIGPGEDVGRMLIEGEADAMIHPHPPPSVLEAGERVRTLFPDRRAAAMAYYRKHGYYPIMHLFAVKRALIEAHPWLARAIMDMWEDAKTQARAFYEDPGYATLAFARNDLEDQSAAMGPDPWPSGIAANRKNLARFIEYSLDQRLIDAPVAVEALFHDTTWDT